MLPELVDEQRPDRLTLRIMEKHSPAKVRRVGFRFDGYTRQERAELLCNLITEVLSGGRDRTQGVFAYGYARQH